MKEDILNFINIKSKRLNILDENIQKDIMQLAYRARNDAYNLNIEDYSKIELEENNILKAEGEVFSLLNKQIYTNPNLNILTFGSYLLYRSLTSHKYSNGNKRTALLLLMHFLNYCGLCLYLKDEEYKNKLENLLIYVIKENQKISNLNKISLEDMEIKVIEIIKKTIFPYIEIFSDNKKVTMLIQNNKYWKELFIDLSKM